MSVSPIDHSKPPQRILLLGSYAPSLINFRGPFIEAMIAGGHEVHVGAPGVERKVASALNELGATAHETELVRQGVGVVANLAYFRTLIRLIEDVRPDLLVTYTIKPNIWGAFAAALTRVRSVSILTGLGFAFTGGGDEVKIIPRVRRLKWVLVRFVARNLYRASTWLNQLVIFQNPDDRDDFIATGCMRDAGKTRLINGSGVDLGRFKPFALPDTPNFLMIARILGAKGVREYASAAIEVKRSYPLARFRLVGFFDEGPDSISATEMDGWVSQGLEYLGPSDDVRPHLADARIYVLPSYREGTPRSVLEAMATGRAILTSDAPGCRETVQNGVNGFLVKPRQSSDLAEKMRWMIDNPEDCRRMSLESLRIVRDKYDAQKVSNSLMEHLGL